MVERIGTGVGIILGLVAVVAFIFVGLAVTVFGVTAGACMAVAEMLSKLYERLT